MTKNINNIIKNNESDNKISDEHNPYKCKLCNKPAYDNAKSIAMHVNNFHKNEMSYVEYFKKYISEDMFKIITYKEYTEGGLPLSARLTDVCFECGETKCYLRTFTKGFTVFCSEKCSNKNSVQTKNKADRTKEAMRAKHGVDNPSQIGNHGEKVKKTKKERYGDENYVNLDKIKETNNRLFGVDSYTQTQEYLDKVKKTSEEKYGVEHFTQAQSVKDKIIATNNERYGSDNPMQNYDIRKKVDDTCIEKYGARSVLSLPSTRDALKNSIQEKYGVDYIWQAPEIRERGFKILNDRFLNRLEKKELIGVTIIDPCKKEFKCDYCNTTFIVEHISLNERANVKRSPRCPECFPAKEMNKFSVEEKELLLMLQHNFPNDTILFNHKGLINTNPQLEVDIYFPDKKIAIEYNGTYWHTEVMGNKKQDYHLFKTKKLWEDHGIQLIHVFSDDWKSKHLIMKSKLLHRLGANKKEVIHARKCVISFAKEDDIQELSDLYNNNHLQGIFKKSSKHVIAKFDNKIVAAMSFSFSIKKQTIELERFCTDINYNINGIGSRLFAKFINNKTLLEGYTSIVSFADICWTHSTKNVYESMGFIKESSLPPRYWYIENHKETKLHRFNFRKKRLSKLLKAYNHNLTEWDNMYAHGYDRLWDCGLYRYVYAL